MAHWTPYLKAQGRCVGSRSPAGLRSREKPPETFQGLRAGGDGEVGQASPAPLPRPRPWRGQTHMWTNTLPLIPKPLWAAKKI